MRQSAYISRVKIVGLERYSQETIVVEGDDRINRGDQHIHTEIELIASIECQRLANVLLSKERSVDLSAPITVTVLVSGSCLFLFIEEKDAGGSMCTVAQFKNILDRYGDFSCLVLRIVDLDKELFAFSFIYRKVRCLKKGLWCTVKTVCVWKEHVLVEAFRFVSIAVCVSTENK